MNDLRKIDEIIMNMKKDQDYFNGLRNDIEKKKFKYEKI